MKDRFMVWQGDYEDWFVIDMETGISTPHQNEKAAKEAAEYNQYCWEQTIEGNERFRGDYRGSS